MKVYIPKSVSMDPALIELIETLAKRDNRNFSAMVSMILWEYAVKNMGKGAKSI